MKKFNKNLSVIVAITMILSILPIAPSVSAEEGTAEIPPSAFALRTGTDTTLTYPGLSDISLSLKRSATDVTNYYFDDTKLFIRFDASDIKAAGHVGDVTLTEAKLSFTIKTVGPIGAGANKEFVAEQYPSVAAGHEGWSNTVTWSDFNDPTKFGAAVEVFRTANTDRYQGSSNQTYPLYESVALNLGALVHKDQYTFAVGVAGNNGAFDIDPSSIRLVLTGEGIEGEAIAEPEYDNGEIINYTFETGNEMFSSLNEGDSVYGVGSFSQVSQNGTATIKSTPGETVSRAVYVENIDSNHVMKLMKQRGGEELEEERYIDFDFDIYNTGVSNFRLAILDVGGNATTTADNSTIIFTAANGNISAGMPKSSETGNPTIGTATCPSGSWSSLRIRMDYEQGLYSVFKKDTATGNYNLTAVNAEGRPFRSGTYSVKTVGFAIGGGAGASYYLDNISINTVEVEEVQEYDNGEIFNYTFDVSDEVFGSQNVGDSILDVGGFTNVRANNTSYTLKVQDDPAGGSGNRVAEFAVGSQNPIFEKRIQRFVPKDVTERVIAFDFSIYMPEPAPDTNPGARRIFIGGTNRDYDFAGNNQLLAFNGGTLNESVGGRAIFSYEYGRWYDFRIAVKPGTRRYDVYFKNDEGEYEIAQHTTSPEDGSAPATGYGRNLKLKDAAAYSTEDIVFALGAAANTTYYDNLHAHILPDTFGVPEITELKAGTVEGEIEICDIYFKEAYSVTIFMVLCRGEEIEKVSAFTQEVTSADPASISTTIDVDDATDRTLKVMLWNEGSMEPLIEVAEFEGPKSSE